VIFLLSSVTLHATYPGIYYPAKIAQGDIEYVRQLIDEYPNYVNSHPGLRNTTPLQSAIDNGQYEIAQLLIDRGARATAEQRALVNEAYPIR
jgi:hypothetical protein